MLTLILCLLAIVFLSVLSWGITCAIVAGICACFGWTFTWLIGTGVWLVLILIGAAVKK